MITDTRTIPIDNKVIQKYSIAKGDILIVRVNGSADIVGRFVISEEPHDAIYCDHFIRMRVNPDWYLPEFLALVGASSLIRDKISDLFITTAGQKTVNQGHISSLFIPILSIEEQQRIVAKIDQLMALCDQLETKLKQTHTTSENLVEATVKSLVAA